MSTLNKITLVLLFIINNNIVTTSFADEEDIRYYDVELIIFKNTNPKYQLSELWEKNYIQTEPETYVQIGQPLPIELAENYNPLLSFQHIENTDYRLNDIVTSLNESNLHSVLLHSAWRQPGMSKTNALNVKINHFIPEENTAVDETSIYQDDLDNTQFNTKKNDNNEQFSSDDNNTSNSLEINQENKGYVLSGYIKLILSRYLHLKIDLIYHKLKSEMTEQFFTDEFGEDDLLPDIYHITQTRRLRSNELHYIDHPVISIIVLITPYKIKEQ